MAKRALGLAILFLTTTTIFFASQLHCLKWTWPQICCCIISLNTKGNERMDQKLVDFFGPSIALKVELSALESYIPTTLSFAFTYVTPWVKAYYLLHCKKFLCQTCNLILSKNKLQIVLIFFMMNVFWD